MYIHYSDVHHFSERGGAIPRDRYFDYYRDLHQQYRLALDERSLQQGSQYTFQELGYPLLDACHKAGHLQHLTMAIASFWSHQYDPDYAAYWLHLKEKYQLQCEMLDVSDQGSLCALTAIAIATQYQEDDPKLLIAYMGLEQTTSPCEDLATRIAPISTASVLLMLGKQAIKAAQILFVNILTEYQLCEQKYDVIHFVLSALEKCHIALNDCIFCCGRASVVFRAMQYYQASYNLFSTSVLYHFYPAKYSSLHAVLMIHQINALLWRPTRPYIVLIEEDVESLNLGIIILDVSEVGGLS